MAMRRVEDCVAVSSGKNAAGLKGVSPWAGEAKGKSWGWWAGGHAGVKRSEEPGRRAILASRITAPKVPKKASPGQRPGSSVQMRPKPQRGGTKWHHPRSATRPAGTVEIRVDVVRKDRLLLLLNALAEIHAHVTVAGTMYSRSLCVAQMRKRVATALFTR